jgi:hypothetical protein
MAEVFVKPPANPALSEIRTAETEAERVVKSSTLGNTPVVNVPATEKYRFPQLPSQHILVLLGAATLLYFAFVKK